MTLSEMRQILDSGRIRLTKSLGQNFLHDGNQLRRIAAAGAIQPGDKILEIGPGLGPLTELLVAQAGEVLAIEKDQRLYEFLKERFGAQDGSGRGDEKISEAGESDGRAELLLSRGGAAAPPYRTNCEVPGAVAKHAGLTLLHDDALDYLRREPRDWSGWKLVSNLPYSVASPILVELAHAEHPPERMVATLQLEVVERLISRADEEHYGILSLLIQLNYEPAGNFKIPGDCFFPAPDVDSGCVTLVKRSQPMLPRALHATFYRMVKLAFSQRRKMMLKLLKQNWPAEKLEDAFAKMNLSPQIRAEKVSLEQFVQLTRLLDSRT